MSLSSTPTLFFASLEQGPEPPLQIRYGTLLTAVIRTFELASTIDSSLPFNVMTDGAKFHVIVACQQFLLQPLKARNR